MDNQSKQFLEPSSEVGAEPGEAALTQAEHDTAGFQKKAAKVAADEVERNKDAEAQSVREELAKPRKGDGEAGTPLDTRAKVERDTARYQALAREHGADLSEEGFNDALRKVSKTRPSS